VELRSFPQARSVTDLLLAVDPTLVSEIRDRGLLAYHLDDIRPALRDLEDYLRLRTWSDDDRTERDRIWDHVKTLRRRVASLN
jgi:regulator of sirC expression with transglutaminase-like and TPR domain